MTNNMSTLIYIFIYLIILIFPFFFAAWFIKRSQTGWKMFWIGILICILAGIAHIASLYGLSLVVKPTEWGIPPQIAWLLFSITTGLLSALFVESLRWTGFHWAKNEKAQSAWIMAAGSGGIVVIGSTILAILLMLFMMIIACSKAVNGPPIYIPVVNYNMQVNCSGSTQAVQQSNIQAVLAYFFAMISIIYPMTLHIATSILVWMAIKQQKVFWFFLAIVWHMFNIGTNVYISGSSLFPWTTKSVDIPQLITSYGVYALIALNILLIVLWRKRAKSIETEQIIEITSQGLSQEA